MYRRPYLSNTFESSFLYIIIAQTFIKAILGPNYSENIINDLQGAYEESKSTVPVLCFVAGNIDPCQSISSLCEKKLDNRNRIKSFTLGRGSVK